MLNVYSDDYSSVTSADIDNALSDDDHDVDDDDDDDYGSGRLPEQATTTGNAVRRVAFAEQEVINGDDRREQPDADGYALRPSCFERRAPERQTLPAAFTTSDLVSGLFFRREMKTSTTTPQARSGTAQRQQARPRSKSAGRTSTPRREDPARSSPGAGDRRGCGSPVATSTPKSAASQPSARWAASDHESLRGERLSNYGQGTPLVGLGRRTCPPTPLTAGAAGTRHGMDGGCSRLLSGRRSVDSAATNATYANVFPSAMKHGVGELAAHELVATSPYGYLPARRRCITPVNEATSADPASLYQLRRTPLPSTPTSAISDSEAPSYLVSGRRSLPRTGCVGIPQGYAPGSFYLADTPHAQSVASCPPGTPGGGSYWPPYSASVRPQSSTTSTMAASADNIRKFMFVF